MRIEEIPKAYRYHCDGCGGHHLGEGLQGHYPNLCPPDWMVLRVTRTDVTFANVPLGAKPTRGLKARAPIEILLCPICRSKVELAIGFATPAEELVE